MQGPEQPCQVEATTGVCQDASITFGKLQNQILDWLAGNANRPVADRNHDAVQSLVAACFEHAALKIVRLSQRLENDRRVGSLQCFRIVQRLQIGSQASVVFHDVAVGESAARPSDSDGDLLDDRQPPSRFIPKSCWAGVFIGWWW